MRSHSVHDGLTCGQRAALYDHAKDCDLKQNTACEACYLWRDVVAHAAPGQPCFESGAGASSGNHVKYIPTVPVAGVEEWSKAGEGAWDCAWGSIKAPLSQQTVALALNPSEHRSQHQMHIHAAALDAKVAAALASANAQHAIPQDTFVQLPGHFAGVGSVWVAWRAGDATSATPFAGTVHPFNTLYTSGTRDMHSTGALVTRRDDKSFYVLAVTGGPVECLLYRPGEWTC